MTIIGNRSKLANSETCQGCARCCKEYVLYDTPDSALRFGWMLDDAITTGGTPFTSEDGLGMKQITFKKECSKLCMKGGKYSCSVWDKERPDFCASTPDNLFEGVEKGKGTLVVMITTEGSESHVMQAISFGALGHICKPFTPGTYMKQHCAPCSAAEGR